jgi:Zn-dependent protease
MPRTRPYDQSSPQRRRGIVVGRVADIDIALHPSWFFIAGLLTLGFYNVTPDIAHDANGFVRLLLAVGLTLIFYVFVLTHEMSHAFVARAYGLDAKRVTLFFFGGVAQIGREAADPAMEFRVALAGPLASLVLAAFLLLIARLLNPGRDGFPGTWGVFGAINLALAGFNLVPGFPLDGGRILRSGLWAALRDRARATAWAGIGGKVVAFLLMLGGVVSIVTRRRIDAYPGAWGLLLGFFLYNLAERATEMEGGSRPGEPAPHRRSVNLMGSHQVTPSDPAATLMGDEGEVAPSDADRGRSGAQAGAGAAGAPGPQPRNRSGHP